MCNKDCTIFISSGFKCYDMWQYLFNECCLIGSNKIKHKNLKKKKNSAVIETNLETLFFYPVAINIKHTMNSIYYS